MNANRLPRNARLKKWQLIRPLFDRTRRDVSSVAHGCIRIVYRIVSRADHGLEVPVQVGFSSGRSVRSAVERNRVKRRLRETYRLNQSSLRDRFNRTDQAITLMILFRGRAEEAVRCIPYDLPRALELVVDRCASSSPGLAKHTLE